MTMFRIAAVFSAAILTSSAVAPATPHKPPATVATHVQTALVMPMDTHTTEAALVVMALTASHARRWCESRTPQGASPEERERLVGFCLESIRMS